MGEILTSDLVHGGNLNPDGSGDQPQVAKRGEALPKGYEGPPSEDELRELGVLVDEDAFNRLGGFEPQGGRALPETGYSLSGNTQKAALNKMVAEEQGEPTDEDREEQDAEAAEEQAAAAEETAEIKPASTKASAKKE